MDFFEVHKIIKTEIEKRYPVPAVDNFTKRIFVDIKWKPKKRNFYVILKVLSECGPCTVTQIVENDGYGQSWQKKLVRSSLYNRIITGSKKNNVSGLVDKGIIEKVEYKDSKIKRYGLTLHGIFFAIKCFTEFNLTNGWNPFDILDYDNKNKCYNYSKQTEYPESIVDILAKNYPDSLPQIFGKWDYLKKHPLINAYMICNIAADVMGKNHVNYKIRVNTKYTEDFMTYSDTITAEFYLTQISEMQCTMKMFIKFLDSDAKEFLVKIFYNYVRFHTENYYRAMYCKSVYDNDQKNLEIYYKKLININDLYTPEQKERFLKDACDMNNPGPINIRF